MTRTVLIMVLMTALLAACSADAGEFAGHFRDDFETGASLTLQSEADGTYTGSLSLDGYAAPVTGRAEADVLSGRMEDAGMQITFRAELADGILTLNLMSPEVPGEVMETLRLRRAGSGAEATSSASAAAPGAVIINGQPLTTDAIAELQATYGVRPVPGNYWYDTFSGLYGVVGYQAFGYMFPGHEFGQMNSDVSGGNTGVFVNGRHLPQAEWLIWSAMLGYGIAPGAYWLDAQGNAGAAGNPVPTVNLFAAAQQNAYRGQGGGGVGAISSGGGDSFWSTRFSAGNSNADNSQGYVSVPGHGPVGYGF